jgi:drug/metabolite transporter (DMT)-like permease
VVVQRALVDRSVFPFLAARFALAAVLIAAISRAELRELSIREIWPGAQIQVWAQRHTTAASAALILGLEPFFAAATSFLVSHERLGIRAVIG